MDIVIVVVWLVAFTVLPTWVGMRMSRDHGVTPWIGTLLGFFLSWLGVLMTWLVVRGRPARAQAV